MSTLGNLKRQLLYSVVLPAMILSGNASGAEGNPRQEVNATSGVIAEIVESKREEGVLTVRMVLRNTGTADASVNVIDGRNFDAWYLTAAGKKYFILRDSEKVPLAPQADGTGSLRARISKGGSWTWWAKYPAPPAEAKKSVTTRRSLRRSTTCRSRIDAPPHSAAANHDQPS